MSLNKKAQNIKTKLIFIIFNQNNIEHDTFGVHSEQGTPASVGYLSSRKQSAAIRDRRQSLGASQSKCEALDAMHQLQPLVHLKQEWEWAKDGGMGGDSKVIVIPDNSVLTQPLKTFRFYWQKIPIVWEN